MHADGTCGDRASERRCQRRYMRKIYLRQRSLLLSVVLQIEALGRWGAHGARRPWQLRRAYQMSHSCRPNRISLHACSRTARRSRVGRVAGRASADILILLLPPPASRAGVAFLALPPSAARCAPPFPQSAREPVRRARRRASVGGPVDRNDRSSTLVRSLDPPRGPKKQEREAPLRTCRASAREPVHFCIVGSAAGDPHACFFYVCISHGFFKQKHLHYFFKMHVGASLAPTCIL